MGKVYWVLSNPEELGSHLSCGNDYTDWSQHGELQHPIKNNLHKNAKINSVSVPFECILFGWRLLAQLECPAADGNLLSLAVQ